MKATWIEKGKYVEGTKHLNSPIIIIFKVLKILLKMEYYKIRYKDFEIRAAKRRIS